MEDQTLYQEIQNQKYCDHRFFRNNPNYFQPKAQQIEAEIIKSQLQLDNLQQLNGNQEFKLIKFYSKQLTESLNNQKNPFVSLVKILDVHAFDKEQSIWFQTIKYFAPNLTICQFEMISEIDGQEKDRYLIHMLTEQTKYLDIFLQVSSKSKNLNDQLVQKGEEFQKLNQQQKELRSSSDKLQQVLDEQMELLKNQQLNLIQNRKKQLDLQSQINQLVVDNNSLQNEYAFLEKQNILKDEKISQLNQSNQLCETKKNQIIKQLEEKIKNLENQINELEQRMFAMKQDKNDLEMQLQKLKQTIIKKEQQLQQFNLQKKQQKETEQQQINDQTASEVRVNEIIYNDDQNCQKKIPEVKKIKDNIKEGQNYMAKKMIKLAKLKAIKAKIHKFRKQQDE